jgi:ParB family chromosome partitioning protein
LKSDRSTKKPSSGLKVEEIRLELIDRPERADRDAIDPESIRELAESIKEIGLQQPILLRPENSRYELVAGDRRFLAHRLINAKTIKAFVKQMQPQEVFIIRATENLQREDLSPLEEARIYQNLMINCGMNRNVIAKKMGRSAVHIDNRLKLLDLPEKFQEALRTKKLVPGTAVELMRIEDEVMRDYYLEYAVQNGITIKVATEWVSAWMMTTDRIKIPGGGSSVGANPLDSVPIYTSCNFCTGPVDIRKLITIHICPECQEAMKKALAGGDR